MTKPDSNWLITVASWEDRFRLGTEALLGEYALSDALIFYYKENDERTKQNRESILETLAQRSVSAKEVAISFEDSVATWHVIQQIITQAGKSKLVPLVDFTTMPRDTLWSVFSLLNQQGHNVNYIYHQPETYADWLSRDPGRPRLVYKLSGLATLGRPTCLIITTGFDPERTRQLMWHYEPRHVLLGFQSGEQFGNNEKNIRAHRESLKDEYAEFAIQEFEIDAYSPDQGHAVLAQLVVEWGDQNNIVMTSLGPKLGAVAMYEVHRRFPETALTYTPSGEFNEDYSKGISQSYAGVVGA